MKQNRKFKTKLGYRLYKTQENVRYAITDTAKELWKCKLELGTLALTGALIYAAIKAPEWVEEIAFKQSENRMARIDYYEKEIAAGKFSPEVAAAISKQIEKDKEDYWTRVEKRMREGKIK